MSRPFDGHLVEVLLAQVADGFVNLQVVGQLDVLRTLHHVHAPGNEQHTGTTGTTGSGSDEMLLDFNNNVAFFYCFVHLHIP